jgi:DNA-binding transcriptional regulator PaaX
MAARWLLLIHQLPPTPAYLRVRVRRRLKQLGAQLLKNSVYVLPHSAEALEDFHWLRREILDEEEMRAQFYDYIQTNLITLSIYISVCFFISCRDIIIYFSPPD